MFSIRKLFKGTTKKDLDVIEQVLGSNQEAFRQFEEAYKNYVINADHVDSDNYFDLNSRQAADHNQKIYENPEEIDKAYEDISRRILDELISQTKTWTIDETGVHVTDEKKALPDREVTREELKSLPEAQRPMLTGTMMCVDIGEPSSMALTWAWQNWLQTGNAEYYNRFRQGLDILDYDPLMYAMIDTNPNSMSHWLPAITAPILQRGFFKIPKTTIAKVPMQMLQLTRKEYEQLTPATLDIVDRYCMEVFHLDPEKEYFIKTGTYSSKFDFRNAYVHGAKEVRELGEYLLFIHGQANMMASPLSSPSIYGVSTTTEWVVREFIHDTENNPCIYKGLPLHTEYRVFVDFDKKQVLGIHPYWDPDVMKKRFEEHRDGHDTHDLVAFSAYEDMLMRRYYENKGRVTAAMEDVILDTEGLSGQWSVDIMQNGDEFWLIDMALAKDSAFKECIPKALRKDVKENWMPEKEITEKILADDAENQ